MYLHLSLRILRNSQNKVRNKFQTIFYAGFVVSQTQKKSYFKYFFVKSSTDNNSILKFLALTALPEVL